MSKKQSQTDNFKPTTYCYGRFTHIAENTVATILADHVAENWDHSIFTRERTSARAVDVVAKIIKEQLEPIVAVYGGELCTAIEYDIQRHLCAGRVDLLRISYMRDKETKEEDVVATLMFFPISHNYTVLAHRDDVGAEPKSVPST